MTTEQSPAEPGTGPQPAVAPESPTGPVALAAPPVASADDAFPEGEPHAGPVDPTVPLPGDPDPELDALLREIETEPVEPPAPRATLGVVALGLALLFSLGTGGSLALLAAENLDAATILAFTTIGATTASFAIGLLAVILRRGRVYGGVAMLISLVANPFIILLVLGLLSSAFGL